MIEVVRWVSQEAQGRSFITWSAMAGTLICAGENLRLRNNKVNVDSLSHMHSLSHTHTHEELRFVG